MVDMKPNLFIAGAARSGTTSLWQYLKVHPSVFMPEDELMKEPTFFSRNCSLKRDLNEYLALFRNAGGNHRWIGEASVAYLTDPESAARIHAFNPDAKIIILLRNPARRAFSLYRWMVQEGYEYASTFDEALKLEEQRVFEKKPSWYKPNYYWGYLYFRSGLYSDQVERYLELFKSNVLILTFEDFIKDTRASYLQVCSFLGIPPAGVPFEIHNSALNVYSSKLMFVLRKLNQHIISENKKGSALHDISKGLKSECRSITDRLREVTRLTLPERIRGKLILRKVMRALESCADPYPYKDIQTKEQRDHLLRFGLKAGHAEKLSGALCAELHGKYAPDIERLSRMTRMDFSGWSRQS